MGSDFPAPPYPPNRVRFVKTRGTCGGSRVCPDCRIGFDLSAQDRPENGFGFSSAALPSQSGSFCKSTVGAVGFVL
jgi:hypothetical protein